MQPYYGLLMILFGLSMIIWRKKGARDVERSWGRSSKAGRSLEAVEFMYAVAGTLFVIFGALRLFKK